VVAEATRLERNLNLVLQVLEITDRVVLCVNLMDEARRHQIQVDDRALARDLGVPVVLAAARQGEGLPELLRALAEVATGKITCRPFRIRNEPPELKSALQTLVAALKQLHPHLPNPRWVALRLLDSDERIAEALRTGELGNLDAVGDAPATH
jgi:ferrous iron transport protein B